MEEKKSGVDELFKNAKKRVLRKEYEQNAKQGGGNFNCQEKISRKSYWKITMMFSRTLSTCYCLTEKLLEDYNDVFSDIVNVLLFDGEDTVKESELLSAGVTSQYKVGKTVHGQERDVAKLWTRKEQPPYSNIRIACLGLENETEVERDMSLRVMGYDGTFYRDQLNGDGKNKSHSRYPVVTLVLYFGTKSHWKEEYRSLYGVLDIPEKLKPYVSDYKINVFEIAWLNDETVKRFKSDFRIVADYFVQVRKNKDYVPSREKMRHVNEVLNLMTALTNDNRFEEVQNKTGGAMAMCEVLDKVENRGIQKGIEQVVLNMDKKGLSVEEIADYTSLSVDEVCAILDKDNTDY